MIKLQRTVYTCSHCLVAKLYLTLATPWTIAHQAPLSMEFPRQEYRSGLPFLSPGSLPDPGIKPVSPVLQAISLPLSVVAGNEYSLPYSKGVTTFSLLPFFHGSSCIALLFKDCRVGLGLSNLCWHVFLPQGYSHSACSMPGSV